MCSRCFQRRRAPIPGTELLWLDTAERRRKALQLIRWAEAERFRNPTLHEELFGSIRFDVGWHATAPEGLPPGSLELPLGGTTRLHTAAALARPKLFANTLGAHLVRWLAGRLICPVGLAPGICVGDSAKQHRYRRRSTLAACYSASGCTATTLGLGFQVFAASAIYALAGSTAIGRRPPRGASPQGGRPCAPTACPLLVFRMGYSGTRQLFGPGGPTLGTRSCLHTADRSTERVTA